MRRAIGVVCAAVAAASVGCTGLTKAPPAGPPLLVGPEAAHKAPLVELPPKQAAVACATGARNLEAAGKVPEAIARYEEARRLDPAGQQAVCRRLAVLYDRAGEFAKADAEYALALKAAPNDADLLNDLGYSHYSRGDWATAERHFAQATQLDPNHQRAWLNRGLAVCMQGRTDEAFQAFLKVVGEAEARNNVAFVLAARGETDAAKAEYRKALALSPDLRAARAALDALENPQPGAVQPAAVKDEQRAARKDVRVPTIQELEEQLNLQPRHSKPIEIDPATR